MHPLLTRNRFGVYLLSWIPLEAILIYLLVSGGRLSWLESTVLVVPLCLVYLFVCLSAWYTARSTPLNVTSPVRLWVTHLLAAAFLSLVWTQSSKLFASLLSSTTSFAGIYGRFTPQIPILFAAGVLFYLLAVSSSYVILSLEASRQAEASALKSSVLAREAELKALKAQVNPHFLFNSLNSISALTSIDATRARDMCVQLGDFLRLTLGLGEKTSVRFSEELELLEKYMAIEKVRFGDRLRMQEKIQEDSRNCLLPPLLLQPLVENAVKHGIASLAEGGEIRLTAERQNGRLAIVVENSWDPEAPPRRKGGMGLKNVQRRLEARYGNEATLLVNAEGELYQVVLSLPAESEDPA